MGSNYINNKLKYHDPKARHAKENLIERNHVNEVAKLKKHLVMKTR